MEEAKYIDILSGRLITKKGDVTKNLVKTLLFYKQS